MELHMESLSEEEQYQAALSRGQILIRVCDACDAHFVLPLPGCPECGAGEIDSTVSAGVGRLYTWMVAHHGFSPELDADVPYVVGAVELEGAARIFARVEKVSLEKLAPGLELMATFPEDPARPPVVFVPVNL
ncbi:OB-fold domain-containing protein [Aeromicrobium sp.]|uniref:Zn-ribbon domain-containing OB-fold protein n=1 Tax=Aeromicrobium sp. TaxID=1871063 RepID=UPI0028B23933|nr:OB-fold domain-containing protein [Aeromicrobium sp.]